MFGTLQILFDFNKKLLQEINGIVSDWNERRGLGPVFEKWAPYLKMYTTYSNKYSEQMDVYQNLMKHNEKFGKEIFDLREKSGSQLKLTE